jgi:cell division protein FtsI (penicillin-binding protein 3)
MPRSLRCSATSSPTAPASRRRSPATTSRGSKTGTAQKPDATGGYSGYRYVASFVGFVPASKPRLVVLVKVDEPTRAIWGGVVAAPAFAEIARFCLQYLEIPPDAPRTG